MLLNVIFNRRVSISSKSHMLLIWYGHVVRQYQTVIRRREESWKERDEGAWKCHHNHSTEYLSSCYSGKGRRNPCSLFQWHHFHETEVNNNNIFCFPIFFLATIFVKAWYTLHELAFLPLPGLRRLMIRSLEHKPSCPTDLGSISGSVWTGVLHILR